MKILVTGGAGYIGSHTIVEIIESGFSKHPESAVEVISADNFSNSIPETFDRIEKITGKKVFNYPIDLTNFQETEKIFREHPDITGIIHFAALKAVGESVEQPLRYYDNNLNSLLSLLFCAQKYKVSNIIFSSSCTVYGELDELPVTEKTPVAPPKSPYGNTKLIGENILRDFTIANTGCQGLALRYFNPVGAHESGLLGELPLGRPNNLVPVITQTAAGILSEMQVHGKDYHTHDGTCIRDYIHVSDIAQAHIKALEYLKADRHAKDFEIFNLGTGKGVSVLEIIQAFEKVTGEKLNYKIGPKRRGDVEAIYCDNTMAKNKLGWQPQRGVETMMESAWKWQKHLMRIAPGAGKA